MPIASNAWLRIHADKGDLTRDTVMSVPMERIIDEQLSADEIRAIANDSPKETHVMDNQSLYLPIIDTSVQFVEVAFNSKREREGAKLYTYKTDLILSVDDTVVVETNDWYSVATVTKIDVPIPLNSTIQYRWVVDIIGTEGHARRLNYERRVIDEVNSKRIASMRSKMLEALGLDSEGALSVIEHVHGEEKDNG